MLKCSNVQILKCSNALIFKCSDVQMFKYLMSNFKWLKFRKSSSRRGGNATDETWICESQREKFQCQKCYDESFLDLQ